jgi:hypothetical protein
MFTKGEQVVLGRGTFTIGESRDGMTRLYLDPADPRGWKCWINDDDLEILASLANQGTGSPPP